METDTGAELTVCWKLSVAAAVSTRMPAAALVHKNGYGLVVSSARRRPSAKNSTLLIPPSGSLASAWSRMLVGSTKDAPSSGDTREIVGGLFVASTRTSGER